MGITVITPAETIDLTTLDTVKSVLGITSTDKDEALTFRIKSVSDFINSYCNRVFAFEEVTETLPGRGTNTILLSRTPIVSVSTILYEGEPIVDYSIKNSEAGILYREYGWANTAGRNWGLTGFPVPNSEKESISVTYTAGYVLPDYTTADRTLPYDLEQAAIDLIAFSLDVKGQKSAASVKVGNYTLSFRDSELPAHISSVLNKYKVVV